MKAAIVLKIIGELYRLFLRDLIRYAVEQSEAEWDDRVIAVLDGLLGYKDAETIEDGI